jgi:energy-coupling factor transporter transmembrane protein EcfT
LIARAETTATLAALLVLTTPWAALLKALRVLRVPALFILILGMTYRFLFVLLETARAFFEARRVRHVGRLSDRQRRQMAVSSAAILLSKSVQLSGEVYEAMQARGACGEVRTLDTFRMQRRDWAALAFFWTLAATAWAWGVR